MNLPNILTMSRIVLAVVLIFLLEAGTPLGNILAVIVFGAAALTDFYDGHLAKKQGLVSDFGKIMDPIADKVLLLSTMGVLAHTGVIAWWMFTVIAVREIAVTVSRLLAMRLGRVLAAERAGKIKTVAQMVAVSSILLYLAAKESEYCSYWFFNAQNWWSGIDQALMILAVILTVYSGAEYFLHKAKGS